MASTDHLKGQKSIHPSCACCRWKDKLIDDETVDHWGDAFDVCLEDIISNIIMTALHGIAFLSLRMNCYFVLVS